jgi:hypothetical protein
MTCPRVKRVLSDGRQGVGNGIERYGVPRRARQLRPRLGKMENRARHQFFASPLMSSIRMPMNSA